MSLLAVLTTTSSREQAGTIARALVAAFALAAASANACNGDAAEGEAVRAVAQGIVAADNRRDIERVLGYYAEDAVLMPPGSPAVGGRAAIRPRYESLFAEFDPRIEARIDEVCVDDALAIVRGYNGGTLVPRGAGATRALDDAWLMVLRRDPSGRWRISHLAWHGAGGAAGPAP